MARKVTQISREVAHANIEAQKASRDAAKVSTEVPPKIVVKPINITYERKQ